MNWIKKLWAHEKGAISIIMAVAITVFLGFTALVSDVGLLYLNRTDLANSADAAVLAGAQELPDDPVEAIKEAEKYLTLNNPGDDYEISIGENDYRIDVVVNKNVKLFFASFFGVDSSGVGATSAAGVGTLTGYKGIVPFGIREQDVVLYEEYELKAGSGDGASGTYGALALGGTGASIYRENTVNGYNEWVRVGDILPTESGTMSGPTLQGVGDRVDNCEHGLLCSIYNPPADCPKILMIPVYVPHSWESNKMKEVQIIGFAAFYVDKKPTGGKIAGQFIRVVMPGEFGVGVVNGYGTLAVKLIK